MSEARELFERFKTEAHEVQTYFSDVGKSDSAYIFGGIVEALRRALATQPEPGAVPELPEWVEFAGADAGWRIGLEGPPGRNAWLETSWCESPDDLDRIAEACHILAARERARRAGS